MLVEGCVPALEKLINQILIDMHEREGLCIQVFHTVFRMKRPRPYFLIYTPRGGAVYSTSHNISFMT